MVDAGSAEIVSARFVSSAANLGFTLPPAPVRLRLLEGTRCWTLFAQPEPSELPVSSTSLLLWLGAYGPRRIEFGVRQVLRADFDILPPEWSARFRGVSVDAISIDAVGEAKVLVSGPREDVAAFGKGLSDLPQSVRVMAPLAMRAPFLTQAQEDALVLAVRMGYYRIPRPVNLQQLAARMNVASGSLSERLRRAEGRVIERYVAEGGFSSWADTATDDLPR